MESEVLSGIKVLVALAKADGQVHEQERVALEDALEGVELPEGVTLASLLASELDVDKAIAGITSPAARKQTYDSACAFVYVDGSASAQERAILEKMQKAFELGEHGEAKRRFWEELDRALAGDLPASHRSSAVSSEIQNAAIYSAAVADVSDTTVSTLLVFANRIAMARNIGLYYGHGHDLVFWKTFVSNIAGAPAPGSALKRLIPGWGRASANDAFAATWALGKATDLYFQKKEEASFEELRETFKSAKKEGSASAKDAADAIAKRKESFERAKKTLDADYANERLTRADYVDKLLALD